MRPQEADAKVHQVRTHLETQRLPGAEERIAADPVISTYIAKQWARVERAVADLDDIALANALSDWARAHTRVYEIIAEEYRQATPQEEWELRYVRWMRIQYIQFATPTGDFYLVRNGRGDLPPRARWIRVEEMIDFLNGAGADVYKTFGVFPVRPESIPDIVPGEQELFVDLTGEVMAVRARRGRHGRRT